MLKLFSTRHPCTGEASRGDIRSMWSGVRKALKHLKCTVKVSGLCTHLNYEDVTVEGRHQPAVQKLLARAKSERRLHQLQSAPDQGRAFHLLANHPSSNHWIHSGAYTSFAKYRFAMRGRLNLLPTRVVAKRAGKPQLDTTCPKCHSSPETLGHVLNACTPNSGLMRERHNLVLQRLVKAVPQSLGDKYVEQKIKDSPGCLKPDLVILNQQEKRAYIVDVTIPFEGNQDAFSTAREEKITKYSPLQDWLTTRGYSEVAVHFIVGSLGAWDTENEQMPQDWKLVCQTVPKTMCIGLDQRITGHLENQRLKTELRTILS